MQSAYFESISMPLGADGSLRVFGPEHRHGPVRTTA
jgi:hypothetical protein